jgi:hypothetical protein
MTFEEAAVQVASRVRMGGRGFLTLRRDELREAFSIGKFTEGQATAVCEALGRQGVFVHPHPYSSGPTLRLYDQKHPVAALAEAITSPDSIPETPLRNAAEIFARETAGRALRSDDAPWLVVFDLFLQILIGREPEGWEDLRDDRHPSELARELAIALGLGAAVAERPSTMHVASAVCAFRSRRRQWLAQDFIGPEDTEAAVLPLIDSIVAANRRLRDDHDKLLRQVARLLLHAEEVPGRSVEVGLLGLRFRREASRGGVAE